MRLSKPLGWWQTSFLALPAGRLRKLVAALVVQVL